MSRPEPDVPASGPRSGWDEEPSREPSIVLEARGGLDLTALADEPLEPPPPPPAENPSSSVAQWMGTARQRMALADFSGAIALVRPDQVLWLNLDHRAGFLLAQVDGTVSYEDLFALSGLPRLETARILAGLVDQGVIG